VETKLRCDPLKPCPLGG